MKKLSVVGIGRLGICFSLTLERAGYSVVGCDIREDYVKKINNKTLKSPEKDVEKYLKESKKFIATLNLEETVRHSDILFVTVRTDSEQNGKYNHSQIDSVVTELKSIGKQSKRKNLVICSNVNPGYSDIIANTLEEFNWSVSYNPECIAQGTILHNQSHPDVVVIGEANKMIGDNLEVIYKNITLNNPKICRMSRVEAELSKLGLNCYMTMKISYANFLGDLTKSFNGNPANVLSSIGYDSRVGNKYFKHGYGYGGPCFPRDNRAMIYTSKQKGFDAVLNKAADIVNKEHLKFQVKQFTNNHDKKEPVFIDGVAYKKGVSIIEESQQLAFAVELAKAGYEVHISDRFDVLAKIKEIYGEMFEYDI